MDYTKAYYIHRRPELVKHILAGKNRILDLGCAEGELGNSLKQLGLAKEVVGIELFDDAAKVAATKLDHVICGDIETLEWNVPGLEVASFDYILCGDVLEHLRDPWSVMERLLTLLGNNGKLIASIPNVRHWSVVLPLLFLGEWQYQSQGIMDRGHLRFFTLKSTIRLANQSGFEIINISPLRYRNIDRIISMCSLGFLDGFSTFQWLIVARRKT